MTTIIPAILATTEEEYQTDVEKLSKSSLKNGWIHIDVMDNIFVPNKSVGLDIIADYPTFKKLDSYQREAHLMVKDPEILGFIDSGFDRIILHIESNNIDATDLSAIKDHQIEVGLAINPETDLDLLKPYLRLVNIIQVMGVHPGYQGQEFIPETIERIKKVIILRSASNADFKIGVDGGMSPENVKLVVDAGVDYIVVGSRLVKGDIDENFRKLQSALKS